MPVEPRKPWNSFLRGLDKKVSRTVSIHCIGGFAMTMAYGVSRSTSDIDFLVVGHDDAALLAEHGGPGSQLHRRFKVYVQPVAVVTFPEDYADRLIPLWTQLELANIRLYALEPHDLALTKLERNSDVDRSDIEELARRDFLDASVLASRYRDELRPNLVSGVERHDLTLDLWVDIIRETQSS